MENFDQLNLNPDKKEFCEISSESNTTKTVSDTQLDQNIILENPEPQSNEQTPNQPKIFDVEDYLMMMQIGTGNFSELYMVEHKETKILYTMKTFTKSRIEQLKKQEDVLMEKHVMNKLLPHDNIINFYGCTKDEMFLYILYEYVNGGELWKKCVIYGLPSEKLIKYYFLQILDGIQHMHQYNILHRDIKPENIMVTKDELTIKIIDFGSCKDMEGTEFEKKFDEERAKLKSRKPQYKNFVGTPNYMAPECVRNKGSDFKSDIWSLGCVLFHMFTGFPPFVGKSDYLIFINSSICNFSFPPGIIPDLAMDLLSKMIVLEPEKRISLEEVYSHPYLQNEAHDEEFRNCYPFFNLNEYAYRKIVKLLKNKNNRYKEISNKLDRIKRIEAMDEDCKRNEITPEETPETENEKKLLAQKLNLTEEYESGLECLRSDIVSYMNVIKISNFNHEEEKEKLINKLIFLQRQLSHDCFNITFEW